MTTPFDRRKSDRPATKAFKGLLFLIPIVAVMALFLYLNHRYQGVKVFKTAFEYEMIYAKAGVTRSQLYVADTYRVGSDEVPINHTEAIKWYEKAAARNSAKADYRLGLYDLEGVHVKKDEKRGFYWMQRAALLEMPEAEYEMYRLLCEGIGTEKDCAKGQYYLNKSGESYYQPALLRLSQNAQTGKHADPDPVAAWLYYRLYWDEKALGDTKGIEADETLNRLAANLSEQQNLEAHRAFESKRRKREYKTHKTPFGF